jgi:transposase
MPPSGPTLLRRVRRAPVPAAIPPRVLGADDWAQRRGVAYGSIVVDLARGCPIDLLPDRAAGTLAARLRRCPTIAVVARDRSPEYARGVAAGAPEAIQVVDRWHLLRNLREALERALARHPGWLAAAGPDAAPPIPVPSRASPASRAQRAERYEAIQELRARGLGLRAVAGRPAAPTQPAASPRRVACPMVGRPEGLSADDRALLEQVRARSTGAATAQDLAQRLAAIVRDRTPAALDAWLADAETSGVSDLRTSARGLRREEAAIRAALTLPWSTGPVEGQTTRPKLLKRQVYGRAKLDLRRARLLAA